MSFTYFGPLDRSPTAPEYDAWKSAVRSTRGQGTSAILGGVTAFLGSPKPISVLGRVLRGRDRTDAERVQALHALGILADPLGMQMAIGLLGDSTQSVEVRMAAARALGRGGAPAIPFLETCFVPGTDVPRPVQREAAKALVTAMNHPVALAVLREGSESIGPTADVADLAAGNQATIAERHLRRLGRLDHGLWCLAATRERHQVDTDTLAMRLLEAPDEAVALEGPLLAMAAPEAVLAALDLEPWTSDHPQAGRRVFLAQLTGSAGADLLRRWAATGTTSVHRRLSLVSSLFGANEGHPHALSLGEALKDPAQLTELCRLLGQARYLPDTISALLVHLHRWPGSESQVCQTLTSLLATVDDQHTGNLVYLAGELGESGCEDALAARFPDAAFVPWALAEIGSTRALQHLRHLSMPVGPDAHQARSSLLYALCQHGLNRGPLAVMCPAAAHDDGALRYALLSGDRGISPPAKPTSTNEACLALDRLGGPWRGVRTTAALDEAALLLIQVRRPELVLHLLEVCPEESLALELLERIQPDLRPTHGPLIDAVLGRQVGEIGLPFRLLASLRDSLDPVGGLTIPPGTDPVVARRLGFGLRILRGRGEDAGSALPILGAACEEIARRRLAPLAESGFDRALATGWALEEGRAGLADSSGVSLSPPGQRFFHDLCQWLDLKTAMTDPSQRILFSTLTKKLPRQRGSWLTPPGEVNHTLDSLAPWVVVLGALTLAGRPPMAPEKSMILGRALLAFQQARNAHAHRVLILRPAEVAIMQATLEDILSNW